MFSQILTLACISFGALAGQVTAQLSIDIGGTLGNITASQFLNITDTSLLSSCSSEGCTTAMSLISNCGSNNTCLCDATTVAAITECQQCMFTTLINNFETSSDPRAGSTVALTAYQTACAAFNLTVPTSSITLTLPSSWDGPFGQGLSVPATVLVVGLGAAIGGSAVLMLSNM